MSDNMCGCDMTTLGAPPRVSIKSYEVQMLPSVEEKARMYPGTGVIQIDKPWWSSLTSAQQDAVLAHELSHDEDPTACEPCTDARAGSRLRHMGYSADSASRALSSLVENRRRSGEWDPQAVRNGWDAADRFLANTEGQHPSGALMAYKGDFSDDTIDRDGAGGGRAFDEGMSTGTPSTDYGDGQSIGSPATGTPTTPTSKKPADMSTMLVGAVVVVIVVVLIMQKKGTA